MEKIESSKPTFIHGPNVKTKIPVPVTSKLSKIPVPTLCRTEQRASLIVRARNERKNIIQPIVTKKLSPKFKEFNLVKNGTKPVAKKKENILQAKKPRARQTTLPENAFKVSKVKKETDKAPAKALEKENAPPGDSNNNHDGPSWKSTTHKKQASLVEEQKDLNLQFEASESSMKQIMNNQLTHLDVQKATNAVPSFKFSDISDLTSEKFKTLSISKSSASFQKLGKSSLGFTPRKTLQKGNNLLQAPRWTSVLPNKSSTADPFKTAMENIKRLSLSKLHSPAAMVTKMNAAVLSPNPKRGAQMLDPFEIAMARIKRLSALKAASPRVSNSRTSTGLSNNTKPLDLYEETQRRIDAWKKTKNIQKTCMEEKSSVLQSLKSNSPAIKDDAQKDSPSIKPLQINEPKTLYRPLKNLMNNPAFQEKRLTDISEHTEVDSSISLTVSGVLKYPRDEIIDHDETMNIGGSKQLKVAVALTSENVCNFPLEDCSAGLLQASKELDTKSKDTPYSLNIHQPSPLAFESSPCIRLEPLLNGLNTKTTISHPAPICTPLALKTMARAREEAELLGPLKLNFDEDKSFTPKISGNKWELRSSVYTRNILTKAKLEDSAADVECCVLMSVPPVPSIWSRALYNPVAKILSEGDNMHFISLVEE